MAVRPYRRAAGVTAGKTSTAGTIRQAGERECTTSELRRMRAVTRGHRIVAPHGERTKRAGNSTIIWIGSVRPSPLPISPNEARSTHRPAGSPVGGPTYRTPAMSTVQSPFGSQSRPLGDPEAQELRPQSSLNSRHLLRGIGFRSLASTVAAEHELAGLVSFDYGQRA